MWKHVRLLGVATVAALSLASAGGTRIVRGQEAPRVPPLQLQTQQLLEWLYPEVRAQGVILDEIAVPNGIQLRATVHAPDSPTSRVVLLTASFDVDDRNQVRAFRARGQLTEEPANRALAERLREAATPAFAMTAEHLPFGPDARVQMRSSPPLAARPAVTMHVIDASDVYAPVASPLAPAESFELPFVWRVQMLVRTTGAPDAIQIFDFEPVKGRVVRMTWRSVR